MPWAASAASGRRRGARTGAAGTFYRSKAYDGRLGNDWGAIQWDGGVGVGPLEQEDVGLLAGLEDAEIGVDGGQTLSGAATYLSDALRSS